MIATMMLLSVLPTCAVVDPRANVATWAGGSTTYRDRGDAIEYAEPVPAIVRELVESRRGTGARAGCG